MEHPGNFLNDVEDCRDAVFVFEADTDDTPARGYFVARVFLDLIDRLETSYERRLRNYGDFCRFIGAISAAYKPERETVRTQPRRAKE